MVHLEGLAGPARPIIQRLPAETIERRHTWVARRASKNHHQLDPRSLTAAGYMMLLTSPSRTRTVSLWRAGLIACRIIRQANADTTNA